MANTLFYYFGDDEAYYKTLLTEFAKHSKLKIEFKHVFESDEKKIQSLFLKTYQDRPACIFIDFSTHTLDYLHLARILIRTPSDFKVTIVGLVDYLSPPDVLIESIATGVDITHIKSNECFDVVYDVSLLLNPDVYLQHGFAQAVLEQEEWVGGIPIKIGRINNEGIHFETDQNLQIGDKIKIKSFWSDKKMISQETIVKDVSTKNLFYHFKYAIDAEFLFVDEFVAPKGMGEEIIIERKYQRDKLIIHHKALLSEWIDDNIKKSYEKKAKLLVIDGQFNFYDDQQRTDTHPFTIRCVSFLEDINRELDRLDPQVIAFSIDKISDPLKKNTTDKLIELIKISKEKYQESAPFIVVFNCEEGSKKLRQEFGYPHLMCVKEELSVDLLVRMAETYEKKLAQTLQKIKRPSKEEKKVFLKKTNIASLGEIMIPLTVIKASESDITIQSATPLATGLNIHLQTPVNIFLNIRPIKGPEKIPHYLGLIHALSELEKKDLRRYVNSIFFREHDAQLSTEAEDFKKLNEAKLLEKLEIDRPKDTSKD